MDSRKFAIAAAVCLCLAPLAGATLYQWTGGGGNDAFWNVCENWDGCPPLPERGPAGYWPHSSADDAIIDGEYDVFFVDGPITIDDLTLLGGELIDIRAFPDIYEPTLLVDVLTIQGSSSPADGDTVASVGGGAVILTYDN